MRTEVLEQEPPDVDETRKAPSREDGEGNEVAQRAHEVNALIARANESAADVVARLIEIGTHLRADSQALGRSRWEAMFDRDRVPEPITFGGLTERSAIDRAEKLMVIADHPLLAAPVNFRVLPPHISTLHALYRLDAGVHLRAVRLANWSVGRGLGRGICRRPQQPLDPAAAESVGTVIKNQGIIKEALATGRIWPEMSVRDVGALRVLRAAKTVKTGWDRERAEKRFRETVLGAAQRWLVACPMGEELLYDENRGPSTGILAETYPEVMLRKVAEFLMESRTRRQLLAPEGLGFLEQAHHRLVELVPEATLAKDNRFAPVWGALKDALDDLGLDHYHTPTAEQVLQAIERVQEGRMCGPLERVLLDKALEGTAVSAQAPQTPDRATRQSHRAASPRPPRP